MAGKQLDEFKLGLNGATGDAIVPEPVGGEAAVAPNSKKGPGDKATPKLDAKGTGEGGSTEAAEANKQSVAAKKSVKEHAAEIFAGQELTEDQQVRVEAIFEAAVAERLSEERAALQEQFDAELAEEVKAITEQVDEYLNYCVNEWIAQNEIAIDTSLRSEIAESLLGAMKDVFEEHYITIPEDKVDAVEELVQQNEELTTKLDEAIEQNMALTQQLAEGARAGLVAEASQDLTATQREKFAVLTEGVEFTSVEEFAKKLGVIKETYFPAEKKPAARIEELMEEVSEVEGTKPVATGSMARYVDSIKRTVKK